MVAMPGSSDRRRLSLPFSASIVPPKSAQQGGRGDGAPPPCTNHTPFGRISSRVSISPTHLDQAKSHEIPSRAGFLVLADVKAGTVIGNGFLADTG